MNTFILCAILSCVLLMHSRCDAITITGSTLTDITNGMPRVDIYDVLMSCMSFVDALYSLCIIFNVSSVCKPARNCVFISGWHVDWMLKQWYVLSYLSR